MTSVVIVGAGVFGAALADKLARDGWEVTLVEQHEPGDPRASSGGESRLLRYSHGAEAWYARSARRAAVLWRELDPSLLVPCGLAWFARCDDGWEAESERVLRAEGIPVERVDATELFPSIATDDLAFTLLEPEAGVLRAQRGVRALAARAVEAGAQLVRARAEPEGELVRAGDEVLEADHVVWACGSWLGSLFEGVAPVRPTLQEVVFFEAGPEWATPPVPGWIDYDGAFYGHGNLDDLGMKISPDTEGPAMDPDAPRPTASQRAREAGAYVERRFPGLAPARLRGASFCPYELTPDTQFIAARHPEHPRVWLYGGGSGHGFKHAPALAERMAVWLTGDEPPEERFGLRARAPETSLRTAGT
jgi:glycine/D-amino acid oxidase-like deaminating enzyme